MKIEKVERTRNPAGWLSAIAVAALAVATADSASAQVAQSARQACRADYQSLCAGVQPGGGRVKACLERNIDRLSPPCRAEFASANRLPGG